MTGRLPFDPSRTRAAKRSTPRPRTTPNPISVSDLASLVDRAVRDHLPQTLHVVGELSNVNHRTHWYFSLKDADAVVDCVMFASAGRGLSFAPAAGQRVVAAGTVQHYAKQGRTQLYVRALEPVGAGALELELRRLIESLRAQGYLDQSRKRPLPLLPRRVAVVTSRTSAALQDVIDTMRRRCPAIDLLVADVRVQGDGAADEIAATLDRLDAHRGALGIDAIVLT